MTRAASSYDQPKDSDRTVGVLCIHALDDHSLPVCRSVKRDDLTDSVRPWEDWPSEMHCSLCATHLP